MKYLLLLIVIFSGCQSYAQRITGTVVDKNTKLPVAGAQISSHLAKSRTNINGQFEITVADFNDTVKISHFVYKTYSIAINKSVVTIYAELESTVIELKDVIIHGERDFKKDSLNNRIAFAKEFNYKAPKLTDAIIPKQIKNTGELISINPLILIQALTKKNSPEYRFQQVLIRDEHEDYVNRKFNKTLAAQITGLKGDTLTEFLIRYRPDYAFVKKSTDYDMEVYIKESFKKFKKEGLTGSNPFAAKDTTPVKLN